MVSPKTLYVISTPIGNWQDISIRALDTLRQVGYILAEDTRTTNNFLTKHNIKQKLISYRDQNHDRVATTIINDLLADQSVALVSDNGTPTISDPGYKLLNLIKITYPEIFVVSIPGPSALLAALSISGLPTDKFVFLGFLPKQKGKRQKMLQKYGELDATVVYYESPYRLQSSLADVKEALGIRQVFIAKDLTKEYEETFFGTIVDVIIQVANLKQKGEFVVCIAKS